MTHIYAIRELNRIYRGLLFGHNIMMIQLPRSSFTARWQVGDGIDEDDDKKKVVKWGLLTYFIDVRSV